MTIGVVLPVYQGAPWIGQALRSLLDQDHSDLRVVVVDDGSSDGSADIAGSTGDSRVTVLQQTNRGVASARNAGVEHLGRDCELLSFHDADDVSMPHRFSVLVRELEASSLGWVTSGALYTDEDLTPVEHVPGAFVRSAHVLPRILREGNFWVNPSLLVRRDVLGDLRYDESLSVGEDVTLLSRVSRRARGGHLPDALLKYRLRAGSLSHDETPQQNLRWRRSFIDAHRSEDLVPEVHRYFEDPAVSRAVSSAVIGLAQARAGHVQDALERFDTATSQPLPTAAVELVKGHLHLAVHDLRAAQACFLASGPSPTALHHLGEIALAEEGPSAAVRLWQDALAVDPDAFPPSRSLERFCR